jgi:hypothetical protein
MWLRGWARINFFTADVRKNATAISRLHLDEAPHLPKWTCLFVRVVKQESLTSELEALETETSVSPQSSWRLVDHSGEQKRGNTRHRSAVQQNDRWAGESRDMDYAHDHCCCAWPNQATSCGKDAAAVSTDPGQCASSRVALGDCVCCHEAKATGRRQELEGLPEEIRHKIGAIAGLSVSTR